MIQSVTSASFAPSLSATRLWRLWSTQSMDLYVQAKYVEATQRLEVIVFVRHSCFLPTMFSPVPSACHTDKNRNGKSTVRVTLNYLVHFSSRKNSPRSRGVAGAPFNPEHSNRAFEGNRVFALSEPPRLDDRNAMISDHPNQFCTNKEPGAQELIAALNHADERP